MRAATGCAAAAGAVLALVVGCGPHDVVCTAVGYDYSLTVSVVDPASTVPDQVEISCVGSCTASDAANPVTAPIQGGQAIATFAGTPATVAISLLRDGTPLEDPTHVSLEWVRTGGTAKCGGPMSAQATITAG